MKNSYQGQEAGEALCKQVEKGTVNIKKVITIAKKHLSEFEEAKVEFCCQWLRWNKKKYMSHKGANHAKINHRANSRD